MSLNRQLQRGNGFKERRTPLIQPAHPFGITARFAGGDDLFRLEPYTDKRVGMAKSQPEHAAGVVQPHGLRMHQGWLIEQ